ncbi:MAG: helix-turn-helix domain-containing protein [Paludibacter sp.]
MVDPNTPLWQLTVSEFTELFQSIQPKPQESVPEEVYMSTKEAYEYLKVSRSTILRWKEDYVPCIKKGGILRFRKSDLDKVLINKIK